VAVTFGELPAFLVGCDLGAPPTHTCVRLSNALLALSSRLPAFPPPTAVLEYTISAAAVARGWTSYAATLFGQPSDAFRLRAGPLQLDVLATLNVFAQCAILCVGMRESSNFNIAINVVNLACIAFVLLAGSTQVDRDNYAPFAPYGVSGVFAGASIVFFSFIGFDTVATAAEEVRNPGRDLPLGILGSLLICTALYAAMCGVITGMVPYDHIDRNAPFAEAFAQRGMHWAASIVSAGAITGITTSLLVSLLGQPRIYMTMARDGLLPAWFARVHARRGTPVNATVVTGLSAGALALLLDIDALAQLVSIGTLCVFCFVCAAVLARRYLPPDGSGAPRAPVLARVGCVAASALAFAFATELLPGASLAFATPLLLLFIGTTASFLWLPQQLRPKRFAVPLMPFTPALGMYATLQLIASLGPVAWLRFIVYYTLCSGVYCYYRGGTDPAAAAAAAAALAAGAAAAAADGGGGGGADAEAAGGVGAAGAGEGEGVELMPRGALLLSSVGFAGESGGASGAGGAGVPPAHGASSGAMHRRHLSSDSEGDAPDDGAGAGGLHLSTMAARRAEKRASKLALLGGQNND
jgi:APA family basic amino acid/polyamine antiporter